MIERYDFIKLLLSIVLYIHVPEKGLNWLIGIMLYPGLGGPILVGLAAKCKRR